MRSSVLLAVTLLTATAGTAGRAPETFTVGMLKVEHSGASGRIPIIFIPALFCGPWQWQRQAAALSDRYDIYVLTLPGFDGTPRDTSGNLMTRAARDINQLIESRHLDRPIIVGHSLGGTLSILFGETYPRAARGIIAVEGGMPAGATPAAREQAVRASTAPYIGIERGAFAGILRSNMLQYIITRKSDVDSMERLAGRSDPEAVVEWMRDALQRDLTPGLGTVRAPITAIVPFDSVIDPYQGYQTLEAKRAAYAAWIGHAVRGRVIMIDHSRHFVMLDQPAEFDRALYATIEQYAPPAGPSFAQFKAAIAAADSADRLRDAGRFTEAAAMYLEAGSRVPDLIAAGRPFYSAAGAFAQAADTNRAFAALDSAIAHGYRGIGELGSDSALAAIPRGDRWQAIGAAVAANQARFQSDRADPERARISTADIPRFWRAYDLAAGQDSASRVAILEREYLAPGTRGLFDFYRMKIRSATRLAESIRQFPRFYQSIRKSTLELSGLDPAVRQVFRRMKALYPAATFPDLYFVVGRVSSAGTATDYGLLFGAEQNVGSPTTVLDELPESRRRIVFPRAQLPHVIAHELVHFQQDLATKHTLLDVALIEGGADFIADLVLPGGPVPYYRTWGDAHAEQVWSRFAQEMNRDSIADWIGNNTTTATDAWPADLGYYVGYEICKAYYDRMGDKEQAIRDLIRLEDSEAILRLSRYAENRVAR
jgi:pimeloyl-ACP methyl ester carboxylesterase